MLRLAVLVLCLPAATLAQTCTPVVFPAGYTSGMLEGLAPADGVICYTLDMRAHDNNLALSVTGRNVAFSWFDALNGEDGQTAAAFVPEGNVEVRVFQLFLAVEPEPYRLIITFTPPGNG